MKAVAVIGYKGSGKTTAVCSLVSELSRRGYKVATVKHAAHGVELEPGKDSTAHLGAGAVRVEVVSPGIRVSIERRQAPLWEVLASLASYDFVILEGFKGFYGARIVSARSPEDARALSSTLVVAYTGPIADLSPPPRLGAPVVSALREPGRLADIVVEKAFRPPAGLNCGKCAYGSCLKMAEAVLRGEAKPADCLALRDVRLVVNGVEVPLKPFVVDLLKNLVFGFVKSLKGVGEPREVIIRVEPS